MNYLLKKEKKKKRKVIHEQVTSKVNGKKQMYVAGIMVQI
jgi:hypothetical protein